MYRLINNRCFWRDKMINYSIKEKGIETQSSRYCRAFTLIELLGVITIALVLMGMLIRVGGRTLRTSRIRGARAKMAALEVALDLYYQDWGMYPPTVTGDGSQREDQHNGNGPYGVCNLVKALTTTRRTGPYIRFKEIDLLQEAGTIYLLDSWGREYVYVCNNRGMDYTYSGEGKLGPFHNTKSYDLYSFGPNGWTLGRYWEGYGEGYGPEPLPVYPFNYPIGCRNPQLTWAFDDPGDGDSPVEIVTGAWWEPLRMDYNDDDINNWNTK